MPDTWSFKATDPVVVKYLKASEIKAVKSWQTDDAYVFEFHEGHKTNEPIYVRTVGSKVDSLLTKTGTLNQASPNFVNTDKLYSKSLTNPSPIKQEQAQKMLALVKANWATFQTIAHRYWKEGVPAPDPSSQLTFKCDGCATTFSKEAKVGAKGKQEQESLKDWCVTCNDMTTFHAI